MPKYLQIAASHFIDLAEEQIPQTENHIKKEDLLKI